LRYSISASISSVPGCSDRVSLAAFCSSMGLVANIFSGFQGLDCAQSACLNLLAIPNQVIVNRPLAVILQPDAVISVSVRWLYATISSDIAVLLDAQYFASFKISLTSDNIIKIDISVPSAWSTGMHSVEIYSNLIGRVRTSSFNIEGRVFMNPNISFVRPSTIISYEDSSTLTIGISSFVGSLNDSRIITLSCSENIVESAIPASISVDNTLSVSAVFQPYRSQKLGFADVELYCTLVYPKSQHGFNLNFFLKVGKREIRIRYFSPSAVVNGAAETLAVEASGVYEILCLYINDVNISDSSKVFFQPSIAPAVKVFKLSTPLISSFMSTSATVPLFVGSCSPPVRRAAQASNRLQVLPPSLPLILGIIPSVMTFTSTRVTLIGQFFDDIQHISLRASSQITMVSWNFVSALSGSGNRSEIVVLFMATAPGNIILSVRIKDSELIRSFTLTHTPTVVRPINLVLPVQLGAKLSVSSSRILPNIDSTRTQLLFNNDVSSMSQCEYRHPNTLECTVPLKLPSGVVFLSLMVRNQLLLNDTTVRVLPMPDIIVTSASKFLMVGGNREFSITVLLWPCVSLPNITFNRTNLLFALTEQKIGDDGFFSATIQIPDFRMIGFQKLVVSGVFDGNIVIAETPIQFHLNAPSIALASGRSFSFSPAGQIERIVCRHFPRITQHREVVVSFGTVFVPSSIVFVSDEEALLDVVVPAQAPQIVTLFVNVRDIRASMSFEYRVPSMSATCYEQNFLTTSECSVAASGGSLYVQLNPAIDGISAFSAFLQTTRLPLSVNLPSSMGSIDTRLEILVPARVGSRLESDLLCLSALGVGSILCFSVSYKVPATPISAYFDSFGASISITFASETPMPVDCRLIFASATLLLIGGQKTVCVWTSTTLLRIVLPPESVVVPGDALHVYTVNSGSLTNISSIEVQPSFQPAVLDVELVGPGNVSVCDTLELEAVVSLSRSVVYSWSCLQPCPQDVVARLQSVSGPRFVASASTLPAGVSLSFIVTGSTFLGASSSSDPIHVYIHSSPLPRVSISPSAKKLLRQDFLELTAISAFASCTVDFERVTFAWTIQTKAPISNGVLRLIQSATQSVLLLQPYSLISGYDYVFTVSIKKDSLENSASVTVTVIPGQLMAVVDGGSRNVSANDLVVLDGSRSVDFDANRESRESLSYCWTCDRIRGTDLEPCKYTNGPFFGTSLQLPCTQVIQFGLQNITSTYTDQFKFSLILRSSDGRVASDSVILSLSPEAPLDVYIRTICIAKICKDSESIVLTTNVSLSFSYKWTLVYSPKLESTLNFDSSNSLLRFQPMALPPGNYEFRCVITDFKKSSGQSSIKFQVSASPKGGSCQCSLPLAPSTTTLVSCSGWNTLFPPLR
jgi:hypothetical protein